MHDAALYAQLPTCCVSKYACSELILLVKYFKSFDLGLVLFSCRTGNTI